MNLTHAIADLHVANDLLDLALVVIERHSAAASADELQTASRAIETIRFTILAQGHV